MEFLVDSDRHIADEASPCDGAYRKKYLHIDYRNVKTPEELFLKDWYETGTNHRSWDGGIARDIGEQEDWFIKFDSLEDLARFVIEQTAESQTDNKPGYRPLVHSVTIQPYLYNHDIMWIHLCSSPD